MQAKLFQHECKKTFPNIKDYGMHENYRSLASIVGIAESVACAMTTSGGALRQKPAVMRNGDFPVVFTSAANENVRCWSWSWCRAVCHSADSPPYVGTLPK